MLIWPFAAGRFDLCSLNSAIDIFTSFQARACRVLVRHTEVDIINGTKVRDLSKGTQNFFQSNFRTLSLEPMELERGTACEGLSPGSLVTCIKGYCFWAPIYNARVNT